MTLSLFVPWIQAAGRVLTRLLPLALLPLTSAAFAQSVTPLASLSFGTFVAGAGSVTVAPNGTRSKTNASYAISLPADGDVNLADGSSHTMAINSFVSSPSGTGALLGNGSAQINVGATLQVSAGQALGSYSGTFGVTLNYE
jgi:hypothetical protein